MNSFRTEVTCRETFRLAAAGDRGKLDQPMLIKPVTEIVLCGAAIAECGRSRT
jgi:hypothetical protein